MKIRSRHVIFAALVFVFGFVALAALRLGTGPVSNEGDNSASLPPVDSKYVNRSPKISLPETFYAGVVPNNRVSEHLLTVKNAGEAPLVINDIRTSCACTVAKIDEDKKSIGPGASAQVRVYIDPMRIPGFHAEKTLTFMTNDLKAAAGASIRVISDVQPEFEMIPAELDFGVVKKGETPERTMIIRQVEDTPLEVSYDAAQMASGHWDFVASVSKRPEGEWANPGKAEYEVRMSVAAKAHVGGTLPQLVPLKTNLKRLPIFDLRPKVSIQAVYTVEPELVDMVPKGGDSKGSCTVKGASLLSVDSLRGEPSAYTATAAPGAAPGEIRVEVSGPAINSEDGEPKYILFQVNTSEGSFLEYRRLQAGNPER